MLLSERISFNNYNRNFLVIESFQINKIQGRFLFCLQKINDQIYKFSKKINKIKIKSCSFFYVFRSNFSCQGYCFVVCKTPLSALFLDQELSFLVSLFARVWLIRETCTHGNEPIMHIK